MKRSEILARRFEEVLLDGTWIANTNYQKQLSDVNLEQATQKVADLNTIALLTFHINYYIAGLNRFFETGELLIKDKHSFEASELKSEGEWVNLKEELISNSKLFNAHVLKMTDKQLDEIFFKDEYGSYQRNIDAIIEHAYYHLGQISLLKRMT